MYVLNVDTFLSFHVLTLKISCKVCLKHFYKENLNISKINPKSRKNMFFVPRNLMALQILDLES